MTRDCTCSDNCRDPGGFLRTRARRALQRNPSDSPPLSVRIKNQCDRLTGEFYPWMKMDSINKITLKTAHNLAPSNLLLSHVFAFPLTFPYLTPHFILPPSPCSLTLLCLHPFLHFFILLLTRPPRQLRCRAEGLWIIASSCWCGILTHRWRTGPSLGPHCPVKVTPSMMAVNYLNFIAVNTLH